MDSFFEGPISIVDPHQPRKPHKPQDLAWLKQIEDVDLLETEKWRSHMAIQPRLSRSLVSFQANRGKAVYRWYKYKEAFSADLVDYLLDITHVRKGRLLDPFAGSGTALFAAAAMGIHAEGIELLPIGQSIISTKRLIDSDLTPTDVNRLIQWRKRRFWKTCRRCEKLNVLRITRGAYSNETVDAIGRFMAALRDENPHVQDVLRFALLCILEGISFTRKDGQYLRWDYRSSRNQGGKAFDKGVIRGFDEAMSAKLGEIVSDLGGTTLPDGLFNSGGNGADVILHGGSCLEILPTLPANTYDCLITSPPYCNRYDYTRTYALELALLGVDEAGLTCLRQEMLSCTVENRAKDLLRINRGWGNAIAAAENHQLLQAILGYLNFLRQNNQLNNNSIPRMVSGYFYEMACVIAECARVVKPGSPLIMVNDNVRYAGASISVDLILSDFAEQLGFTVEKILILPGGKGNSSQQMGAHGREPLRKCVYIWRKA